MKLILNEINRKHEYNNDFGDIAEFSVDYNELLIVNMPYIGVQKQKTNAQGWLRDRTHYFEELLSKKPEYFSRNNVERIMKKRSPYCDKVFVNNFPEYNKCLGNKLIHHHIGKDGQAVAVPQDIHVGIGGVHLVEESIGIDTNAIRFSSLVTNDVSKGNEFSWEEADQYIGESFSGSMDDTESQGLQQGGNRDQEGIKSKNHQNTNQTSSTNTKEVVGGEL